MEYCFHITRVEYLLNSRQPISDDEYAAYLKLIQKRARHIPLQHITGVQEFMGLSFQVNEAVLIPRQDTEVLVEEVLKVSKGKSILDLCTGSGCIIISLDKLGGIKSGVGVDISEEALAVARQNGEDLNSGVTFLQSDLYHDIHDTFDIIVSNPPYIPTREIESLMEEVRVYDPMLALDGKADGLYFYRKIAQRLKEFLNPGGFVFFEIGHDQGETVSEILKETGIIDIKVSKDLAGLDRIVSGRYKIDEEPFT
ncbi:release factor glutamine methyltransferase [Anaerocolumna cellulosilytica]|uniref:Release factor glutamine methyltransferase n=2 Tax=Anaerocolumna cellulosilytica TaxID=433286 RepID=A0A6S6QZ45_9FIRM|nr:release factor glutamine methyltransferase [Anaerocolumna cellulosilytica]